MSRLAKASASLGAEIGRVAVRPPVQHEIPQHLALRRQQRAVAAAVAIDAVHVERDDVLQERLRVRPGDADHGAVIEMGGGHFSRFKAARALALDGDCLQSVELPLPRPFPQGGAERTADA